MKGGKYRGATRKLGDMRGMTSVSRIVFAVVDSLLRTRATSGLCTRCLYLLRGTYKKREGAATKKRFEMLYSGGCPRLLLCSQCAKSLWWLIECGCRKPLMRVHA